MIVANLTLHTAPLAKAALTCSLSVSTLLSLLVLLLLRFASRGRRLMLLPPEQHGAQSVLL
jgi:hypothetical protein